MRLFTVQPKEVIDKILKQGSHVCDPSKSSMLNDLIYQEAYDWMVEKMNSRLTNKDNIQYPVWAWYKIDGVNELPDFNLSIFSNCKTYLLELEVPDEDVLLSDFENWHFPLNDWYYIPYKNDDQTEKEDKRYRRLPFDEQLKVKYASWNIIFKVKDSDMVQATFWKIKKENLIYIHKILKSVDLDTVIEMGSSDYSDEDRKEEGFTTKKLPELLNNYYINAKNRYKYLNKKKRNNLNEKRSFKLSDEEQEKINTIIELYKINKSHLKFL